MSQFLSRTIYKFDFYLFHIFLLRKEAHARSVKMKWWRKRLAFVRSFWQLTNVLELVFSIGATVVVVVF